MTRQEPHKPIKSENEQILVDSSSLPPKKMHNEKLERFGIPSNERKAEYHETEQAQIATEYVTETSDVGVLSDSYPSTHTRLYDRIMSDAEPGYLTNQGPIHQEEDHQTQSEGRRLNAAAFQAKCTQGYVDCDNGKVNGDSSTSCATACNGECCTGDYACNKFTGKGKQRVHFS